jgi:hypothetical protein
LQAREPKNFESSWEVTSKRVDELSRKTVGP